MKYFINQKLTQVKQYYFLFHFKIICVMSQKKEPFSMVKAAFSKSEDLSFGKRVLYFALGVTIEPLADLGECLNKIGIKTGEAESENDPHYD